jgi:hypothetical protein
LEPFIIIFLHMLVVIVVVEKNQFFY